MTLGTLPSDDMSIGDFGCAVLSMIVCMLYVRYVTIIIEHLGSNHLHSPCISRSSFDLYLGFAHLTTSHRTEEILKHHTIAPRPNWFYDLPRLLTHLKRYIYVCNHDRDRVKTHQTPLGVPSSSSTWCWWSRWWSNTAQCMRGTAKKDVSYIPMSCSFVVQFFRSALGCS